MTKIGIRELKAKTSEVVREVRQHHTSYVVTHRGEPVGVLAPYEESPQITLPATETDSDAWEELFRLGEEIQDSWSSSKTSLELLSEIRR